LIFLYLWRLELNRTFRVVLDGTVVPGADRAQVLEQGARIFRVDLKKMDELLGGEPRLIKGSLDEETARRYERAIVQAGMACHVEVEAPANDSSTALSEDDASTGFSCPKCGYRAAGAEGGGAFEECPRCGIVVRKYLSRQASISAAVPQDEPIPAPKEDEYEPASTLQRRYAAAGSFFVPLAGGHLIGLVAAIILYFSHYHLLSNPMPGTVEAAKELEGILDLYESIRNQFVLLILFAYFVYFPSRNGGTWAQRHMGIQVVSMNPEKQPGILAWFLRAVANFVCMATMGLLSLLPLLRTDRRSLADLVSGTRQVRREAPEGDNSRFLTIVTILALVVSAGSTFSALMLLTPPRRAERKTVEQKPMERKPVDPKVYAQQNRQVLEQVSRWEEIHLKEYGSYTSDAMKLFAKYANMRSSHTLSIHSAIMDNRLRLELTDSGFRAIMPVYGVPDAYQVYTEKGDQGVQTMVLPKVRIKR
jgi:uncharacterized RDD family membrane protein YckC/predicted RNA-binding Zn-ribbon protein involved in translation (DUF1610 family)